MVYGIDHTTSFTRNLYWAKMFYSCSGIWSDNGWLQWFRNLKNIKD